MKINDVAEGLVALCREGKFHEAMETYYGENIVSVEGTGEIAEGLDAVRAKVAWWDQNFEVHSVEVQGPFVGHTGFSVMFNMDATDKSKNARFQMTEVAVYDVEDGKIVREEFYYKAE